MIPCITARRYILLAGTIAGSLLTAPAFAQHPPASVPQAAAPTPTHARPLDPPLIARPEGNDGAAQWAPSAPPPTPPAPDKWPTAKLKLPPGFSVEVYVRGFFNPRSFGVGENGRVFGGPRLG